jgi:uncharacterized membrane protein YdfJ with MMPL/SSD domain
VSHPPCDAHLVWECSRWRKPTVVWPGNNFGYPMMTCRRCRSAARWRGWGVKVLVRPWVILVTTVIGIIGGGIIAGLPGAVVGLVVGAGVGSLEEWFL